MVRLRLPGGRVPRAHPAPAGRPRRGVRQRHPAADLAGRGCSCAGCPTRCRPPSSTPWSATGVLPTASHERVRNIVASPLTGLCRRSCRRGPADRGPRRRADRRARAGRAAGPLPVRARRRPRRRGRPDVRPRLPGSRTRRRARAGRRPRRRVCRCGPRTWCRACSGWRWPSRRPGRTPGAWHVRRAARLGRLGLGLVPVPTRYAASPATPLGPDRHGRVGVGPAGPVDPRAGWRRSRRRWPTGPW